MLSENFDDKIKERLDQRPEGIDHPQWEKMESLLDKHLPQKKDNRRRFIFFLLFFLFAGGGTFLIWKNNAGSENTVASKTAQTPKPVTNNASGNIPSVSPENQNKTSAEKINDNENNVTAKENISIPINTSKDIVEENKFTGSEKPQNIQLSRGNVAKKKNKTTAANPVTNEFPTEKEITTSLTRIKENTISKDNTEEKKEIIQIDVANNLQQKEIVKETDIEKQQPDSAIKQPEEKTDLKEKPPASAPLAQKQKKKNNFSNKLFFTVSAGPDLSMVGFDKAGKVKPVFGAGIGYQVSKTISIRTGIYSARKIYSADPEDYDPPANFWAYYPNLKNIDADCKVTEIPVTVDFVFAKQKNNTWFASAGLSTLLMKKEIYEYYFKPNYSPNYITYTKQYENVNKHYFSILNLSGGYRRTINKTISLQAEPYFKIATGGVGYGKVKLNSGGVLFSAIIKPFASKNQ